MGDLASYTTSPDSPLNQGVTSRTAQKLAALKQKTKAVEKADLFPTESMGSIQYDIKPPESRSADYYRDGKYQESERGAFEIAPRGFVPIDNQENFSSIRIYGKNQKGVIGDIIPAYSKFIIESVQESSTERSQIIETFGDFYVFMFDKRPSIYNFSGQLINSYRTNWVNDFTFMYENYFRGTKCVEMNARTLITYGGRQVEGLILNMATQTSAAVEGAVALSFSVVVFDRKYFLFSEDLGFSSVDGVNLLEDEKMTKLLSNIAGPEGRGMSSVAVSDANNVVKDVMDGKPAVSIIEK